VHDRSLVIAISATPAQIHERHVDGVPRLLSTEVDRENTRILTAAQMNEHVVDIKGMYRLVGDPREYLAQEAARCRSVAYHIDRKLRGK
jgi:hypothetical protein